MPRSVRPSAISERTSRSRGVSWSSGLCGADCDRGVGRRGQGRRPSRRQRRARSASTRSSMSSIAFLQEIADPLAATVEQPEGVLGLDVLRQQQHADLREAAADLLGDCEAFVAPGWRHADVDDCDVGAELVDRRQELVGGADLRCDLDAGFGEDAGESFAEDGGVVCERYAHGIVARRLVPRPEGLSILSSPSSEWRRSARPRRPVPREGSAPPMPLSSTSTSTCAVRAGDVDADAAGTGVLGDVGERFGDEEVDGCFGSCGQPRLRRRVDRSPGPVSVPRVSGGRRRGPVR